MPESLTGNVKSSIILNVNDDEAARYITTRILQKAGFTVVEAQNGTEALRLAQEQPSLVVLDVNMPDINGVEVCRRLKADATTTAIPVLHLSATRILHDDRVLGLESGADGYLTQPVEPEVLTATVRALLRLTRAEERVRSAAREWQAVFDAVSDGVCLLDPKGNIQRFNRAFPSMIGFAKTSLQGRSFRDVLTAAMAEEPPALREQIEALVRAPHEPIEIHTKQGRWFRLTREQIDTSAIAPADAVYILTDITQTKESARRQRAFLRDVLASVTEGKLRLCDNREELPDRLSDQVGKTIALNKQNIRQLRQRVLEVAKQQGFTTERLQDLETAVGEAAMNAVVHARSATGEVRHSDTDGVWLQVWIEDHGNGIADDRLHRATLERGFSSAGTLGHGFWLMLQIVDRIWLLTSPEGTTVVLEQRREALEVPAWLQAKK